jgi:uncharacterized membrane protein
LKMDGVPNATVPSATEPESRRLKGAISYVLLWVTGLIMLWLEVKDPFVKFHSLQSILYSLALMLIAFVPVIGWVVFIAGWLYGLYGAYEVYSGREFKVPYIGEFVEKNLM